MVSALLTMGRDMAPYYVQALKNQDICRSNCSADTMTALLNVLTQTWRIIQSDTSRASPTGWEWVEEERRKLQAISLLKNEADEKFRRGMFMEAIQKYTDVLEVCEILLSVYRLLLM